MKNRQQEAIDTPIAEFVTNVIREYKSGQATEHSYRPYLKVLFEQLDKDILAINEPKHIDCGAPDFSIQRKNIPIGYVEAKDLPISLHNMKGSDKNQQCRYRNALPNLIYTNCLDWDFYRNGERIASIRIAELSKNILPIPKEYDRLKNLLCDFLAHRPQVIKSREELAKRMAGKAALIKDVLLAALKQDEVDQQSELYGLYKGFRKHLVHDISIEDFADMYAETIVYGMFIARLQDKTKNTFSRDSALRLLPRNNLFLYSLFSFIAGQNLDSRLVWVIDDLANVFQAVDVTKITKDFGKTTGAEDPFIHFYETFLATYNPKKRRARGVYYTPVPIVRYIVRAVNKVLMDDFGLAEGLSDTTKVKIDWIDQKGDKPSISEKEVHLVQILDPAVGTGTFLAEIVKAISANIKSTAPGMWSSYVENELFPRLHGFELLMAPYTMCHLKLGMILNQLGYKQSNNPPRLGVYLTNSLEKATLEEKDLFLAPWFSQEIREANNIKLQIPIMCVVGNPPYAVSSSNKGEFIQNLIADYKKNLNERKINLDDDYIKFIRFAEYMISNNGSGIVAMITNNSYLDGPTHRQMRKHLLTTFDKIYVLNLHGNITKKETNPDGSAEENVFDIKQGVAIAIMIKNSHSDADGKVYYADLYGTRKTKFDALNGDTPKFKLINYTAPYYFFVPKDFSLEKEYLKGISLNDLFDNKSSGFRSGADDIQVTFDRTSIETVVTDLKNLPETDFRKKYPTLKDGRNHNYAGMKADTEDGLEADRVIESLYRPFDTRWTYYSYKSSGFAAWPRNSTMNHFIGCENVGLIYKRGNIEEKAPPIGITSMVAHERAWSRNGMQGADTVAPLHLKAEDLVGSVPNFNAGELKKLTKNIGSQSPENILDYIYAVLHSQSYCTKYMEFLRIEYPRVPIPTAEEFNRLLPFGRRLRELHLMVRTPANTVATYPAAGSDVITKVTRDAEKVYINDTQYFDKVSDIAWNSYIGGYQPAQQWLKDRIGRKVTYNDIKHYQRIIAILEETAIIVKQIG